MRVTHSMMVKNLSYWTSKQLERFNDVQTVVAAGKQINRPSDDPGAAGQIMSDQTSISACGQYRSNILKGTTWIESSNDTLDMVRDLLNDAKDIVDSQDFGSEESEATHMAELESLYNEAINLANSQYDSTYMYSGNYANTIPFDNSVTVYGGASSDILFDLAEAASDLTITISDSSGNVVRTIEATGGVEGTNTIAWDGCDEEGNPLSDGEYSFTVSASNSSGDAVAVYPSYRGGAGGKEVIIGEGSSIVLDNNGGDLFSEALSALSQAIGALNGGNTSGSASDISDALQAAIGQSEAEQVALSNINSQLETAGSRLEKMTSCLSDRISTLEGSTTVAKERATIELQAQETAYESALETASLVLKMGNLVDYLAK